jgi:hypothetical protein
MRIEYRDIRLKFETKNKVSKVVAAKLLQTGAVLTYSINDLPKYKTIPATKLEQSFPKMRVPKKKIGEHKRLMNPIESDMTMIEISRQGLKTEVKF